MRQTIYLIMSFLFSFHFLVAQEKAATTTHEGQATAVSPEKYLRIRAEPLKNHAEKMRPVFEKFLIDLGSESHKVRAEATENLKERIEKKDDDAKALCQFAGEKLKGSLDLESAKRLRLATGIEEVPYEIAIDRLLLFISKEWIEPQNEAGHVLDRELGQLTGNELEAKRVAIERAGFKVLEDPGPTDESPGWLVENHRKQRFRIHLDAGRLLRIQIETKSLIVEPDKIFSFCDVEWKRLGSIMLDGISTQAMVRRTLGGSEIESLRPHFTSLGRGRPWLAQLLRAYLVDLSRRGVIEGFPTDISRVESDIGRRIGAFFGNTDL